MIDFKIIGYQRVGNALRMLASTHPEVIEDTLGEWAQDIRHELKSMPYPPKRPNQKYIRTGRLANSWNVKKDKPGQVSIQNSARGDRGQFYGPYVVGDADGADSQAWMHEGRWWLAADVIGDFMGDLTRRMSRDITSWWEQNG